MLAVPKLVSMDNLQPLMTRQGQMMASLVSADLDGTATTLLSAGVVRMKRGHNSRAHRHHDTDVIVLLWRSGAVTLYGDRLEHEIWQRPGQALWIPRGVPHAALNLSRWRMVVAWEFRSNPILDEDNDPLEELEPIVAARRDTLLRQGVLSRRRRFG